jgi:calcineurin-like phosphoesterase family protein
MRRFFIADTHFGASLKFIIAMNRCYPGTETPFESTKAHDDHLIGAINMVAGAQDEVYVVGDFCSKKPGRYRARINCKHVYLIRGNHDPVQASKRVFGEIPYIRIVKVRSGRGESLRTVLCHNPIAYWEGSHNGWGHLYGHCHGAREHTLCRAFGASIRAFDVGVDPLRRHHGDYFPIAEDEVFERFMQVEGHDHPAFYDKYRREFLKGKAR